MRTMSEFKLLQNLHYFGISLSCWEMLACHSEIIIQRVHQNHFYENLYEPGSKIEMFHDRYFAQKYIVLSNISGNFRNSFSNIEAIYSYFAWKISSLKILNFFMVNLPWHFRSIIFRVRKLRNVDFPDPDEPIIAVNVPFHSLSYFQVKGQGHNFY